MLAEVIFADRSPAKCQRKGNLGRSSYLQEDPLGNTSADCSGCCVMSLREVCLGSCDPRQAVWPTHPAYDEILRAALLYTCSDDLFVSCFFV